MYCATTLNRDTAHALPAKQRGIVVLDILIGAFVGLIVLGAAIKVYVDNITASSETLKSAKLNQEVNAVLQLISRDVTRAGYYGANPLLDDLSLNPFWNGFNDVHVSNKTGEPNFSCVLYSYDLNKNMAIGVSVGGTPAAPFDSSPYDTVNVEQFGFRQNGNDLEMRQGLAPGDTDVTCDNGTWIKVNSNIVNISSFLVTLNSTCYNLTTFDHIAGNCASGNASQYVRSLDITVAAQLSNDPLATKTASIYSKIRNDKFVALEP